VAVEDQVSEQEPALASGQAAVEAFAVPFDDGRPGRMKVVMDDGEEMEYGPGDLAVMAPGHDAWTVGDESCVVIDWQGFADYAKR
jgi:hypothetical protein